MRVLFISTNFPTNLRTQVHGNYKRLGMFIDAIRQLAHIDLLFYVPRGLQVSERLTSKLQRSLARHWNADIQLTLCPRLVHTGSLSKWQLYGAGVFNFFGQEGYRDTSGSQQVQTFEQCLRNGPDLIFAHKLVSMCPLMLTKMDLPPVLLDRDDIDHLVLLRRVRQEPTWRTRFLHLARLPALLSGEYRGIRLARRMFVCSEEDRQYLAQTWRIPGIMTVPNAVTIPKLQPPTAEPTLLFIGSYSYQPNVEAAEFLIKKVWPRIKQQIPNAHLTIAGASPESIPSYNNGVSGVEFTGFVDDLDALYGRSRVICAPIFSGAGTRVKIVEAAAYGKPMVATRLGAEGLQMRDGHELLLRDDAESFAEGCINLLGDLELCRRLGSAARDVAIQRYDRVKVIRLIQEYITTSAQQLPVTT